MKIKIVYECLSQAMYWKKLIALVVPNANIVCKDIAEASIEDEDTYELLFLAAVTVSDSFYDLVEKTNKMNTPLICNVEKMNDDLFENLKMYGVKGYVNVHCTIDELQTAIRIICNRRGTFLNF